MVLYVECAYKRQELPDGEGEEEETDTLAWILLFVDLVYVALLSKLSYVMEYCALSVHSFLFIITIFSVLFVTRLTIDDYACRLVRAGVGVGVKYLGRGVGVGLLLG